MAVHQSTDHIMPRIEGEEGKRKNRIENSIAGVFITLMFKSLRMEKIPLYRTVQGALETVLIADLHSIVLDYILSPSSIVWVRDEVVYNVYVGLGTKYMDYVTSSFDPKEYHAHLIVSLNPFSTVMYNQVHKQLEYYHRDRLIKSSKIEFPFMIYRNPKGNGFIVCYQHIFGDFIDIQLWSHQMKRETMFSIRLKSSRATIVGFYVSRDGTLCAILSFGPGISLWSLKEQNWKFWNTIIRLGKSSTSLVPDGIIFYKPNDPLFFYWCESSRLIQNFSVPHRHRYISTFQYADSYLYALGMLPTGFKIWRRRWPLSGSRRWRLWSTQDTAFSP